MPSGCGEGLHSELRAFLGQRLPDYMVPSAFVLLDAWPLTPNGKLDHTALPQPHASDGAREPLVAPRDHAERWLAQIWADLLHTPVVDIHANFFALGGHSLLAVRMMAQIQQRLGWSPPLTTLLQAPTIAQLAAHLRQQRVADTWSPLVALQAQGRRRPLFLIHPIGGTVLCYADLARQMGPDQPVYGLQARGVEHGQTPHRSVAALAEEYLAAIRSVQPGGPYRLGGWSFGGVVAFAIASQFQRQGETIELLALIDSAPPMPEVPLPDDTAMLHAFLQDLGGMLGTSLGITVTDLAPLAADERLAYVLAQAQRQEALLPGMDLDRLKRLAAVFSANLSMLAAYPAAPAPLPVALLVAEVTAQRRDLAGAWRALATVVQDRVVPGTHYTLLRSPHVQAVADWLGTLLVAA
ncbi:MAG TPA: thioesterase domain-containing protein [Herpetosiphonaceae bacterium]